MKQLLFATALILSMAMNAHAWPVVKNKQLLSGLKTALKTEQAVTVANTENYRKLSFHFNDKTISAFYDADGDELIGFAIPMSIIDISPEVMENIEAKFAKYSLKEAIMFVKQNGVTEFYVSMSRPNKPTIVLKINANGKAHYFGKE